MYWVTQDSVIIEHYTVYRHTDLKTPFCMWNIEYSQLFLDDSAQEMNPQVCAGDFSQEDAA